MRTFFFLGVVLLALSSSIASAQKLRQITLEQAVNLAQERNIGVIQAENTLEAQESSRRATFGDFLPSLSASGDWSRNQNDRAAATSQTFGGATFTSPASFSVTNNFSVGLNLRVTLFNGFTNTANMNRASANVTVAEQSLYRTRQQTVYETTQLYLNVLRTRELLKVRDENLRRSQKQLERITESNKVGALSLADVYRQQVQVSNDELILVQAQNDYDKAKADLSFYLALSVIEDYDFSDPAVSSIVDTMDMRMVSERYRNVNVVMAEALKVRPDYRSAVESYNGAGSAVSVARGGHFPTISAFASRGYGSNEFSRLTDNKSTSWGLSISLPLFSGFRIDNQVEQAKVNERIAFEQMSQAERKVQIDIRKAMLDFEAAQKQIDLTQKSVKSAFEDRRIAEEKYNLGAGTLLDLIIANANYVSSESNKVNAVYNYYLVKKQLELATGTLQKNN